MSQGDSNAGHSPLRIRLPLTAEQQGDGCATTIPQTGTNSLTSAPSSGPGKNIAKVSGHGSKTEIEVKGSSDGAKGASSTAKANAPAAGTDAESESTRKGAQTLRVKSEPATASLDGEGALASQRQTHISNSSSTTKNKTSVGEKGVGGEAAGAKTTAANTSKSGTKTLTDNSASADTAPLVPPSPVPPSPGSTTSSTAQSKGKRKKAASKNLGGKSGGKGAANKQLGGKHGSGKQVSGKGGGKGAAHSSTQTGGKGTGKSGRQGNQNAKHKDKDKDKDKDKEREKEGKGGARDSTGSSVSANDLQRPVSDRESFIMAAEPFGPVADAGGRFTKVPLRHNLIEILKPEKRVSTSEASLLEALRTKDGFVTLRDALPKRKSDPKSEPDSAESASAKSVTLPTSTSGKSGTLSGSSSNVPPKGKPGDPPSKQQQGKGTLTATNSISKTNKEAESSSTTTADVISQQEVLEMLTNQGLIPAPWQDQADAQLAHKHTQIALAEAKVAELLAGNPRSLASAMSALQREKERAKQMERDRNQALQDERDELLLCTDTLVIPGRSSKALIKRMQAMAVQNGLAAGCDEAAFGVVADAVRTHLKTILRACLSLKVKGLNEIGVSAVERLFRPARCPRAVTRSSQAERGGATGSMEDVSAGFNPANLTGTGGLGGLGMDEMGLVGGMSDVGLGLDLGDVSMGGFGMEPMNMGLMGLGMDMGPGIEPNAGLNMGTMGLGNMGLGDMTSFGGVGMGGLGGINAYGGVNVGGMPQLPTANSLGAMDSLAGIQPQGLQQLGNPSKLGGVNSLQGLDGGLVGMNFNSDYLNANNPLPANESNETTYMSTLGDGQIGSNLRLSGTTTTSVSGLNTNYDSPASSTSPIPPASLATTSPQPSLLGLGGLGPSNIDTIRNMSATIPVNSTNINLSTSPDNRAKALKHTSTQPSIFAGGVALDGLGYGNPATDSASTISRMSSLNLQRSNSLSFASTMRLSTSSMGNTGMGSTVPIPVERTMSSYSNAGVGGFGLGDGLQFEGLRPAPTPTTTTTTGVSKADPTALSTSASVGFQSPAPVLDLGRINISGGPNPANLSLGSSTGYFQPPNPPSPNQFSNISGIGTGSTTALNIGLPGSSTADNKTLFVSTSPTPSSTSAQSGVPGVTSTGAERNGTMGILNNTSIVGITQTPTNTPNSEVAKNNDDENVGEGWGRLQSVGIISLEDLVATFQVYPHLRGDNQLSCERLLSQLWQLR